MKSIGVVIVAGGSGKRMKSEIPKQFIKIGNKAILQHTIDVFFHWNPTVKIVVVLPEAQLNTWRMEKDPNQDYELCAGGDERFFSVKNGMELLDTDTIMIHDGVRPLVSFQTLDRCWSAVKEKGSALPVIDAFESIRKVTKTDSHPVDRNILRFVQTPQCFKTIWLQKAFDQPYEKGFTDDASVVQKAGYPIHLVEGNRLNIKITTPEDLELASYFLLKENHGS